MVGMGSGMCSGRGIGVFCSKVFLPVLPVALEDLGTERDVGLVSC
jgi:hypothetical protein